MASQVPIPPPTDKPVQVPGESAKDKMWRKLTEQPLVPIGSLLTVGALLAASHHLRTGNRDKFQKMLRWRVALQGGTVLAMIAGTVYFGSGTASTSTTTANNGITSVPGRPPTVHQVERAEQKKEAQRLELQERMREAESKEQAKDLKEKEAVEQLLRPGGSGLRSRPVIGKDSRTF